MITGKKEAAAKPKANATTSATKPGGLIPEITGDYYRASSS